jgi:hypothetical protein
MIIKPSRSDAALIILEELCKRGAVPRGGDCYVEFAAPSGVEVRYGDDLPARPGAKVIRLDDHR